MDTLYGTDAAFGLSEGFDADLVSDESSRFYKLAFPQIYGNVFLPVGPGISCKVGKFYSLVGNEWLYNTENFFYSHFLSWNIQPGTHTGLLFETKLLDQWELRFGPNLRLEYVGKQQPGHQLSRQSPVDVDGRAFAGLLRLSEPASSERSSRQPIRTC